MEWWLSFKNWIKCSCQVKGSKATILNVTLCRLYAKWHLPNIIVHLLFSSHCTSQPFFLRLNLFHFKCQFIHLLLHCPQSKVTWKKDYLKDKELYNVFPFLPRNWPTMNKKWHLGIIQGRYVHMYLGSYML